MTITSADLDNRFQYHAPNTDAVRNAHENVRAIVLHAARLLVDLTPEGREQSLMVTHLEDAMMWANAAIARNQEQVPS